MTFVKIGQAVVTGQHLKEMGYNQSLYFERYPATTKYLDPLFYVKILIVLNI